MTGDCHVRFCERLRGEIPLCLLGEITLAVELFRGKAHFAWWDEVVRIKSEKGENLTMTAEFGPHLLCGPTLMTKSRWSTTGWLIWYDAAFEIQVCQLRKATYSGCVNTYFLSYKSNWYRHHSLPSRKTGCGRLTSQSPSVLSKVFVNS